MTIVECPRGKKSPHPRRALALLHHLTGYGIDGGDMIGVDRIAQAVAPGEEAGGDKGAIVSKSEQRPGPAEQIGPNQRRQQQWGAGNGGERSGHVHKVLIDRDKFMFAPPARRRIGHQGDGGLARLSALRYANVC